MRVPHEIRIEYGDCTTSRDFLYLRHGSAGLEGTWSEVGRAGVILDNLVARRKALPMIIVMPNGYASDTRRRWPQQHTIRLSTRTTHGRMGAWHQK